jgi:hypothetical protein
MLPWTISTRAPQSFSYDGKPHPAYTMYDFTPLDCSRLQDAAPWLKEHRSLYDALGADYALVRISGIEAAACRGVPFAVIDVYTPDARALYTRNLTLIRPDHHVAWRSDEEPAAPLDLMDLVRGARPISTETPG